MAITPSLVDVVRPLVTIAPLITLSIVQSTLELLKQFLLLSHALFPLRNPFAVTPYLVRYLLAYVVICKVRTSQIVCCRVKCELAIFGSISARAGEYGGTG